MSDLDFTTSLQEAEQAALSAMLTPAVAQKHIGILTPEDFESEDHRRLYTAMQALYIQHLPITEVTVSEELCRHYKTDMPMMQALLEARRKYAFTRGYGLETYAGLIREHARRRRTRGALLGAAAKLEDASVDLGEVLEDVRRCVKSAESGARQGGMEMADVLIAAFTELEGRVKGENRGIPYGIADLDRVTAGLHRGEMTLIGARPSVGKSALASQIALSAARSGARVLVCSREMTAEQYGIRILMRGTSIPSARVRSGQIEEADWAKFSDSLELYGGLNVRFAFAQRYVEDLRRMVQELSDGDGLDVLIVDYAQLMQTRQRFDKDYLRIGYVSKALKDMSVDFNLAVVALAQVGRSADGDMPTLAELRGSGDLEQDADNVIFMHRPESASDKWVRREDADLFNGLAMLGERYIVLNVAKQRQGETGSLSIVFNPQSMEFKGIARGEAS